MTELMRIFIVNVNTPKLKAFYTIKSYWSEESPTLGCSIDISRDICRYVDMSVCLQKIHMPQCVGGITWPKHMHAQSQFQAIKTDLLHQ